MFIAMYLDNVLTFNAGKQKLVLVLFLCMFGIIPRNIPQLNIFIVVCLVGLVATIVLTVLHKNMLKSIISAALLMALLFGIEGLTLLTSRLVTYEPDLLLGISIYMAVIAVVFLLALILRKFLEKHVWANILNHKIVQFLLISASVALLLILKNFAIEGVHITLGQWTVDFGDIAFMLFFAASVTMVVIIVRYVSIETALRAEMLLTEASKKYVHDLEESYKALRTIKHDYVNILTSFKLYIDSEDVEGLKRYYYDELTEMNQDLLRQDQLIGSLQDVRLSEIKSILIYKSSVAAQHGIDIEAKDEIDNLGVSTAIVCQILGILLDNAIEAAVVNEGDKKLHIAIIKNPNSKVFVVKNSWKKQVIPISKLYELGFTTKAEGQGLGLFTVRKYTERIKSLYLETEMDDEFFIQTLTVKDD